MERSSSSFPLLGVGVGLRPLYYPLFVGVKPPSLVSWVEVISENFMDWPQQPVSRSLQNLEKVRSHCPVVLHGVSLSIGGSDPLRQDYLKSLKNLIDRIEPSWVSDHLCWTGVDGVNLHDLLPLPYTNESLAWVSQRVMAVQEFLGRPLLLENPSTYLQCAQDDMTEWDFLAQLAKKTGCGLLLDINNVYVSAVNHGFCADTYLNSLPADRVFQIHLAGHTVCENYCIDTHDTPVCEAVWDLYTRFASRFAQANVMIERDDHFPPWEILEQELQRIHCIQREHALPQPSEDLAHGRDLSFAQLAAHDSPACDRVGTTL